MKKTTVLRQVTTPDGSLLTLVEHDGHYTIRVNGRELMSTRHVFSEQQLGVVGCEGLRQQRGARVLIGGLGLGFTLRAALASLARDAQVVVAELVPEVIAWNRDASLPLAHAELADRRTSVALGDVSALIADSVARFDAILLDADNETTAMNTAGNSRLYLAAGIASIARALKPGGAVVYWSASDVPRLVKQLDRAGFQVERRRVRKYEGAQGGGHHLLVIGRQSAAARPQPSRPKRAVR